MAKLHPILIFTLGSCFSKRLNAEFDAPGGGVSVATPCQRQGGSPLYPHNGPTTILLVRKGARFTHGRQCCLGITIFLLFYIIWSGSRC